MTSRPSYLRASDVIYVRSGSKNLTRVCMYAQTVDTRLSFSTPLALEPGALEPGDEASD